MTNRLRTFTFFTATAIAITVGISAASAQDMISSEPTRPAPAHHPSATPTTGPATQKLVKIQPDLAQRVEQLVAQLNDESYKTREAATAALADVPADAVPYLEDQLKRADLPPEAQMRIEKIIGPLRDRAKRHPRLQEIEQWNQQNIAEAYDKIGDRNPKWDKQVEQALSQAAAYFSPPDGQRNSMYVEPMMSLCDQAMHEGCKDPMVRLVYDRLHNNWIRQSDDRYPSDLVLAAQAMEKSKYSGYEKATANILAANDLHFSQNDPNSTRAAARTQARKLLLQAKSHFAEVAADAAVPREELIDLCKNYLRAMQAVESGSGPGIKIRTQDFQALDTILAKGRDENDPMRLMATAYFDITRAEDESGEWGEGPQVVHEWLSKAATAATESYKQDPKLPCASMMMLNLCRSLSLPAEDEELWFARAVDADPDGIEPYRSKLLYLQSTQSDDEAEAFARECFLTNRWAARIPVILSQIRLNGVPSGWYWDNRLVEYWGDDNVWKDVTDTYTTCLKRYPDSWFDRSFYALLAFDAQHWDVADEQMKLAGDHVKYQLFGGKQAYELLRAEVAMRLKNPTSQPSPKDLAVKHTKEMTDYYQRITADAYEKVGHHSDKWDADARELLRQAVLLLSGSSLRTRGEEDSMFALGKKLDAEGCEDPLVKYIVAYVDDWIFREELAEASAATSTGGAAPSSKPSAATEYRSRSMAAALDLAASDYPASMRVDALVFGALTLEMFDTYDFGKRKADAHRALQLSSNLFTAAVVEKDWPLGDQITIADNLMIVAYWDGDGRKSVYDPFAAALAKVWPAQSPRLLCLEAVFEGGLAQDIPTEAGNHPLGTFTGPRRAEFDKHESNAERLYEQAWLEDPTDPLPPTRMMVIADLEDRPTMVENIWFHRAMLADADNFDACEHRMYFLDPFHHGSSQFVHNFGHECCWTENWGARIPLMLGKAHYLIGCDRVGDKNEPTYGYYRYPQVWHDTVISYGAYLEKYPADTETRSTYAKLACIARQWDVADHQFKLLGDHPRLSVFGTHAKYETLRHQAATEAAKLKPAG